MRTCSIGLLLLLGGCQASVGDDDDTGNQIHALPPLTPTPEGYASRPGDSPVALPDGTTITVDQFYSVGHENPPIEVLGGSEEHILVTLTNDNPGTFPGTADEELLGLNAYVNGVPLPLERSDGTRTTWFVEGDEEIPITLVPSNFMVWEIRAWRCPPEEDEPDAGAGDDAGSDADADADTDTDSDTSTDTSGGTACPNGEPIEVKVVFRAIDELPPGEGEGAGLPNFTAPTEGQALTAGGKFVCTWEPLGLADFTCATVEAQMSGWIIGGTDVVLDGDIRPVDADRGSFTFNVGSFADWDLIAMNVVIPLENFSMRVVGTVGVNP